MKPDPLSHTHTLSLSLSHSQSHTHTHIHTHTHTHTRGATPSNTNTCCVDPTTQAFQFAGHEKHNNKKPYQWLSTKALSRPLILASTPKWRGGKRQRKNNTKGNAQ